MSVAVFGRSEAYFKAVDVHEPLNDNVPARTYTLNCHGEPFFAESYEVIGREDFPVEATFGVCVTNYKATSGIKLAIREMFNLRIKHHRTGLVSCTLLERTRSLFQCAGWL